MKTYTIRQTSPALWGATLFITIFLGSLTLIVLAANGIFPQPWLFVIIFTSICVVAFKIPRYTATGEIELTIDENGIKKKWLKQLLFHNRSDLSIKWIEIKDYVFEPDRQFDKFKMHIKDGTRFQFFHNNDHNDKDDFLQFLNDFESVVKEINTDKDKSNDIKRGKTIYESVWGLILAGFAIIMLIGIPIILFVSPTRKTPNYGMIGLAYLGAVYYIFQVFYHRRKYKDEK